uniref:Mos1 transposase HTH domain-containing protein n=1 Tax=Pseudonaja textilis TaxID=8673 RepID=A0A670Y7B2_PSETE
EQMICTMPLQLSKAKLIRFLLAKNHKLIEIFRQLCEVYGDNIITEGGVRRWCIKFKNGRTNVHDEQLSGRPSILTDELVTKVDDNICENRRFTVTELSLSFPQISHSLLHEIVTQKLGYHKFCARWVSKILTENHMSRCMAASLTFLYSYDKDGDSFLDRIVTRDKTWVKHVNGETKLQSMEWGHTNSPQKPRKCLQTFSARKIMATVFGDRQCVLLIDFLDHGATINSVRYCEMLQKLRKAIQNKRRGKLSSKILFLHDNARPHTANHTREVLNAFKWEIFPHPPYSPDLAPSDYHLFPRMKTWLGTQRFDNDAELQAGVTDWLKSQAAEFYDNGITKLVHRYDKCLNLFSEYVEK